MYSKMHGRCGIGGNGLCDWAPSSSKITTSPFSTSRTYCAPMMSRAQVSDARMAAVELADDQRPDPKRVSCADQLLVGETDESVGALELTQAFDKTIDETVSLGPCHKVQDHLGVGGGLHHRPLMHEVAAQLDAIGKVAVVTDSEAASIEFGEQRLHVP